MLRSLDTVALRRSAVPLPCAAFGLLLGLALPSAGGELRGRVLVDGQPAAGVTVSAVPFEAPLEQARRDARRREPPRAAGSAVTRADGTFVLVTPAGAGAPTEVELTVSGPAVASARFDGIYDSVEAADVGELEVARAESLAGRVLDPQGGPVVGATVTLWAGGGRGGRLARLLDDGPEPLPVVVTTGADGAFRFGQAAEQGNRLRVEAPGFAFVERRGLRAGPLRGPIRLEAGRTLAGTVTLPGGRTPAPGALVRFEGEGSSRWVETLRDGTFLLDGVPADAGSVVADGGDRGRGTAPIGGSGTPRLALSLAPTASLRGRVVDAGTGAPVPRIRVAAQRGGATWLGRSGPDGRYEVKGLPAGRFRLSADDPRYVPWRHRAITLSGGEAASRDVALTAGSTLTGRVTDGSGAPVEGARGQVVASGDNPVRAFLRLAREGDRVAFRTGRDGSFKATRLRPGRGQTLSVRHDEYEPQTQGGLTLVAGTGNAPVTVVLRRGLAIRGIVRDPGEKPLPGAEVELLQTRQLQVGRGGSVAMFQMVGGPDSRPRKTTGSDGRFEFQGLLPGDYTLNVSKPGYTRERVDPVKVAEDAGTEGVEVVLAPGATISGSVRDKRGLGVSGLRVMAQAAGQRGRGPLAGPGTQEPTGPDGAFLVEGLTSGQAYDLQVVSESGLGPRKAAVAAPADGVEFVVSGTGRIRGVVVDAETGRPLPDFEVSYDQASDMQMRFRFGPGRGRGPGDKVPVHAEDGAFTLEDVTAGTWDVEASADGYQSARSGKVVVEEGGTTEGVEVRLSRGGGITGRVLDPSGRPVIDASVSAQLSGGLRGRLPLEDEAGPTTTDAEGRFEVRSLAPGSYTVHASHAAWSDATASVSLKEGSAAVEIRLGKGGTVAGAVGSGGRPVPGATVTLEAAGEGGFGPFGGGGSQVTLADAAGRFRFERLQPGRYTAGASLRTQSAPPVEVVLAAGQSREDVALELLAGATVRGRVLGLPDADRSGVSVSGNGAEGYMASTRTGADGSFELTGVPAGPLNLRASVGDFMGGRSATKQVVVPEGQIEVAAEIVFEPGFRVTGRVTRAGRPVPDAFVSAMPDVAAYTAVSAGTDENGAFTMEGLREASYNFVARPPGGGPIRKQVAISGDATVDLEAPPARLAGIVVEADSRRPLAEAMVDFTETSRDGAFRQIATSDSGGRFALENLEPKAYRVTVSKAAYQAEAREVVASETSDLVFELRRGEGIGVQARDALLGTPLRGLFARVLDAQGTPVFTGSVPLDSEGRGEVSALRPGSYQLRAEASGYAPVVVPGVAVPAPIVSLALTPGGTLEIQAGPETLARPGAAGRILRADGTLYLPSIFSSDGLVRLTGPIRRLENVAPGRYSFVVEGVPPRDFTLAEGGRAVVTLP